MGQRVFRIRQRCRYRGEQNTVEGLVVEHLAEGEWVGFDLDVYTPGFLVFVYSVLSCQHLYLRANAAERGLVLESGEGSITLVTSHEWQIETVRVRFDVVPRSGRPRDADVKHIVARMKACPVSSNIREQALKETSLVFRGGDEP